MADEPTAPPAAPTASREMTFTATFQRPPLDQGYADALTDERFEQIVAEQEAVAAAVVAPPADATPAAGPPPPSPLVEGIKAGFFAAGAGAEQAMQGLTKALVPQPGQTPGDKLRAVRQFLIEGLMGVGMAPFVAAGAAGGQAFENVAPELARAEALPPGAAFTVRHLLAGAPGVETLPPEQLQALKAPMTWRELLETAATFGLPLAPKGVQAGKAVAGRVKEQLPNLASERGSAYGEPPGQPAAPGQAPATAASAAARVNLARVDATDAVKAVMAELSQLAGERLAEHRKPVTHEETLAASRRRAPKLATLLDMDPETLVLDKDGMAALHDYANAAATHVEALFRRAEAGDPKAAAEFMVTEAIAVRLVMLDEAAARNTARALEIRKEPSDATRQARRFITGVAQIHEAMAGADDPPLFLQRVAALQPAQRKAWLQHLATAASVGMLTKDTIHAIWVHNLLTSPRTQLRNLIGTGGRMAYAFPERYTEALVNKVIFGSPDAAQFGEVSAMVRAHHRALEDGWRLMSKAWREAEAPFEADTSGKLHLRITPEQYGFSRDDFLGRWAHMVGTALERSPVSRGLIAGDAFYKGMAYRYELAALAYREGRARGLAGAELDRVVAQLEAHPTPGMVKSAMDYANVLTLNTELGKAGTAFMTAANAVPGGRVVFPFMRWNLNRAKFLGQRAFPFSALSPTNWQDLVWSGDPNLQTKAIARFTLGAAFTAVIALGVQAGWITGAQLWKKRRSAQERDLFEKADRPDYSFLLPGFTVEYKGAGEPLASIIGTTANAIELWSFVPEEQDQQDKFLAYLETMAHAAGYALVDSTAAKGAADVIDSIAEGADKKKIMLNLAKSVVPTAVRHLAQTFDGNVKRDIETMRDAIFSGIPFASDYVKPYRNPITGEAITYPPGLGPALISPVYITTYHHDVVFQEIAANGVRLPPVPRVIAGQGPTGENPLTEPMRARPPIKLSDEQQDFWETRMASLKNGAGRTLREELQYLMRADNAEYWKESLPGPDGRRAFRIRAIYDAFKERGYRAMRKEFPDLDAKLKEREREAGNFLRRTSDPKSPGHGRAMPGPGTGPLQIQQLLDSLRR